jgi:integrase
VLEWYAQIQYRGRREKVGLGTNNKEAASRRATHFYSTLREKGWDVAMEDLSPDHNLKAQNVLTIGDYIEKVRHLAGVRPRTFEIYAYALRKIAREALGRKDNSRAKFDPTSHSWRKATDLLPLRKLTPDTIANWKLKVLSESGQDPVAQQRARRNVNSFARNARALFSKKILKKLAKLNVELPAPLPFEGFEFEEQGSTKYTAKIDAGKLLQSAKDELAQADPEAWKVILLALGAGLRRAEIDGLLWSSVDSGRGEIRIVNHAHFEAKTQDSEGVIFVDPSMLAELDRFRSTQETDPVVEPGLPFRQTNGVQHYRCQEILQRVTTWLRSHGVTGDKPLHTLRKEFGSIICAAADIHTASRQLRHSNLSTTAAYYADHRKRATVPVGALLKPAATPDPGKQG